MLANAWLCEIVSAAGGNSPGISWNPHLGEAKNFNTVGSGFLDMIDSLVNTCFEIVPDSLGLDCADSDCLVHIWERRLLRPEAD